MEKRADGLRKQRPYQEIHLSGEKAYVSPKGDLKNVVLTGVLSDIHSIHSNLIKCKLVGLEGIRADLESVDVKDCIWDNCHFEEVNFEDAGWMDNRIQNTIFIGCDFEMTTISGTVFANVTFRDCNLAKLVMKSCKFYRCTFENCQTSNRLIEMSLLLETVFSQMDVQVDTIVENFGIQSFQLNSCRIRTKRTDEDFSFLLIEEFESHIQTMPLDHVSTFRSAYFLSDSPVLNGSEELNRLFEIESWLSICGVQSNLTQYLQHFYEFLSFLYEENKAPLFVLIKLHHMTGQIVDQADAYPLIYLGVMGIHMALVRDVEEFYNSISNLIELLEGQLTLKVNGPVDLPYYENLFAPWLKDTSVRVFDVKKANSPNFLSLIWENREGLIPIVALALSTRFSVSFKKLKMELAGAAQRKRAAILQAKKEGKDLIIFSEMKSPEDRKLGLFIGNPSHSNLIYELKLRAIFPSNTLVEMRLSIGTQILSKLQKAIVDVILPVNKAG